jgi:hypothetical protein
VTGTQPAQPTLACYETASFNTTTCSWDVTGTQPAQPTLACYESASFNTNTCSWDVTGSPNATVVNNITACGAYTWSANGQTYTASGTYSYYANCQDYALNLTITNSNITLSASTNNATCFGGSNGSIDLSVSGGTAPYSYSWSTGATTQDVTLLSAGTYTVLVTDAVGCAQSSSFAVTQPIALPVPGSIQGNVYACLAVKNDSAIFSIAPVTDGVNTTTYNWSFSTSKLQISSGQGTPSVKFRWISQDVDASITGTMTVVVSNPCTSYTVTQYLAYSSIRPVTPGSISGSGRACPGDIVTYSVTNVPRATYYDWNLPTGMTAIGSDSSNVITVSVAAGFNGGVLTVAAGNPCGISGFRSKSITATKPTTPGVISGTSTGLCNAGTVNYSITPVAGATSYSWSISPTGAGANIIGSTTGNSIQVIYGSSTTTTYTLSVIAVNGCGSSNARTLSVSLLPARPATITASAPLCPGATITYSIPTVSGATSYVWTTTSGGTVVSGQGTKSLTVQWSANITTQQSVSVRAVNGCGQSSIRSLTQTIGTCLRESDLMTQGLQLVVYPNPTTGPVLLRFISESEGDYQVRTFDLTGRLIQSFTGGARIGENIVEMNLPEVNASGVYFIEVENEGMIERKKVLVE